MDQSASLRPHAASSVLQGLVDAFPNERVTAGELIDTLDERALGALLLVLALPMCIPNVPGISTIFGVLMVAPALQLALGQHKLWVPKQVRAMAFPREGLTRTLRVTIPSLRRVEYLIRPRFEAVTQFPFTIYVGIQTLLMAVILVLPIPFANWPPGMTVAMTALALLQRDGLLMLLTMPAAIASAASVYFGTKVGLAIVHHVAQWVSQLGAMWF